MLKKVLDLPTATEGEGLLPDAEPTYVTVLVDELAEQPRKPQVADTLTRHSSAAACLKRVALLRDGVEPEPMDLAGFHVTNLGTLVHEAWQAALERQYRYDVPCEGGYEPAVQFEVPTTIEDLTSGSCDAWLPAEKHVLELKTTGGFGYKLMVGERGAAQGPKSAHMVQLALNVKGLDADKGTLVYLSNEAISKGAAERKGIDEVTRFGAQWTFTRDQLDPLADEWLEQLRWVKEHDTDEVPRWAGFEGMPKGARLDPNNSTWTLQQGDEVLDTGKVWGGSFCDYCPTAGECRRLYAEGR